MTLVTQVLRPGVDYHLNTHILAIATGGSIIVIPAKESVTLMSPTVGRNGFVEAAWRGETVQVFARDLNAPAGIRPN